MIFLDLTKPNSAQRISKIQTIQQQITPQLENAAPAPFELAYYNQIHLNKYIATIKSKHRKTTITVAVQTFPEEALYYAIQNNDQRLLTIIKPSNNSLKQEQIERARETPIENILDSENIKHHRSRASCPLCNSNNETTLSFKHNIFKCFKCDKKGDAITFIQELKQIPFKNSVEYLNSL